MPVDPSRLRAAFARGDVLDLPDQEVEAEAILALLLGEVPAEPGQVAMLRLSGARITGQLDLDGAELRHRIELVSCTLEQDLLLNDARTRAITLVDCTLPAFRAGLARVDGDLKLSGCTMTGAHIESARVEGDLDLSRSHLQTLQATGVRVAGHLFLTEKVEITGLSGLNYIAITGQGRLSEAKLGRIEMHRARFESDLIVINRSSCESIELIGTTAQGRVDLEYLRTGVLKCTEVQAAVLHLPDTEVRELDLDSTRVGVLRGVGRPYPGELSINGLTYDTIEPAARTSERLAWIRLGSGRYQSQPYEQLAAFYKRTGHETDARTVLLAKQRHRRGMLGWSGRLLGYLQDITAGYGYRSWWAGAWLVACLVAGTAYFLNYPPPPLKSGEHPDFSAFAYTLDLLLPMVDLGQTAAWNPHGVAQVAAYLLILVGWLLTLSVATGITRMLFRD
ncbi:MAG: hypothetical protein HOY71_02265 [Nonomuraea sp.]|nr:hypothetical protein [Nonomuraea sp.]